MTFPMDKLQTSYSLSIIANIIRILAGLYRVMSMVYCACDVILNYRVLEVSFNVNINSFLSHLSTY